MSASLFRTAKVKSVLLIVPYFGQWPEWMGTYIESVRFNPTISWIYFTDCGVPPNPPQNAVFVSMTLPQFNALASERLGVPVAITVPYHLCDLKPAYPDIFSKYAAGFDYVGWADIDLVYGNLRPFVDEALTSEPQAVYFHAGLPSGHLTLLKNTPTNATLYQCIDGWQGKMGKTEPKYRCYLELDEKAFGRVVDKATASIQEYFTTPSYFIRSDDGTFDFPREWYWRGGRLTNSKYGEREYPYFHWILWKGYWPEHFGWKQWRGMKQIVHAEGTLLASGVRINRYGFFPLSTGDQSNPSGWRRSLPLLVADYHARRWLYAVRRFVTRVVGKLRRLLLRPPTSPK